jgi:hypothetical protein
MGLNILIVEEMPQLPSRNGSWLTNNVAKRQHDAIHQAISTTCLNEQECYDALWSYLTSQYEIDFVCNPDARSDYCRYGKAKGEIVGGCWIMPDRGLTDWL